MIKLIKIKFDMVNTIKTIAFLIVLLLNTVRTSAQGNEYWVGLVGDLSVPKNNTAIYTVPDFNIITNNGANQILSFYWQVVGGKIKKVVNDANGNPVVVESSSNDVFNTNNSSPYFYSDYGYYSWYESSGLQQLLSPERIAVEWTSYDGFGGMNAYIETDWDSYFSGLDVDVSDLDTPNNPIVSSSICGQSILTQRGVPIEDCDWYWQGKNPNGTSTDKWNSSYNPEGSSVYFTPNNFIANEGTGIYYIRARHYDGTWSTRSGSVYVEIAQTQNWYLDADQDGYGSSNFIQSCLNPSTTTTKYVTNNLDINDSDATVKLATQWCLDINGDGVITDLDTSYAHYNCVNSTTRPADFYGQKYIPTLDENSHWIHTASFDPDGFVIGSSKTYFDDLGKANVSLSKDYQTNTIWGTETAYDNFGRPDKSTFAVPSGYEHFIKSNYLNSFGLSNYYSDNNALEPFQATATQPYSQTNYDNLNPGNVINVVGGNKINNEWKTGYSYTVPAAQEMYYVYGYNYYDGVNVSGKEEVITKFFKSVVVDANGVENVSFSDGEGKVLATARSGGVTSYPVVSLIGTQGYVDVHIPAGISSSYISLIGNASLYKVYNLKTGLLETGTLTGGNAYRIEAVTPPATDPKTYILMSNGEPSYDAGALGISYRVNYYDYAVNVYNKTGQLIKSVQPKGCNLADIVPIKDVTPMVTSGNYATIYSYNDQGQIKQVVSPDEGTSKFLYRQDGQIRYSQSALQADTKVSYTDYDTNGRPIESGVIANNWANASVNPDDVLISGTRSEKTLTIYDYVDNNQTSAVIPANLSLNSLLTAEGIPTADYIQNNLSGNVAVTYKEDSGVITAISWYSYDIYGRVEWIAQYNQGLGIKTIHYDYDYKGNVNLVTFQKDKTSEQFIHRYFYDTNGVLTKVQTATYGTPFITHADYSYYKTGELKRVNIAQGLQGLDYVYTLGGQLKSINHPSLEAAKDPGGDANDVFGLTLDYYNGDYQRTGRNITTSADAGSDYNGNIKAARWKNKAVDNNSNQKAYLYSYDRNNWLTSATYGTADSSTAAISPSSFYKESGLSYDANGNILSLQRTNASGSVQDNLSYSYKSLKNQLDRVTDAAGPSSTVNDIGTQAAGNYNYNSIGQLEDNISENLHYIYNTQGLVSEVQKLGNTLVKFFYNERGQRIKKESYNSNGSLQSTSFYALDLSGNTMAVYFKDGSNPIVQKDLTVYGLSRLGVYNKASATTSYEITDHLGNVRAVVQKNGSSTQILDSADYYPFGEKLIGRDINGSYRYAFQGQELDSETGMEAFQLRLWDGRIGRWLSPDPMGQYASPYLGMGNNPISGVDPDGGFWQEFGNWIRGNGWNSNAALDFQANGGTLGEWHGDKISGHREATFVGNDGNVSEGKLPTIGFVKFKAVDDLWDNSFRRSMTGDKIGFGVSWDASLFGGGGSGIELNWILTGKDKSFFPYFGNTAHVTVSTGANFGVDFSTSKSWHSGPAEAVRVNSLPGWEHGVEVGGKILAGGAIGYSYSKDGNYGWHTVSGSIGLGFEASPLTALNVKYTASYNFLQVHTGTGKWYNNN